MHWALIMESNADTINETLINFELELERATRTEIVWYLIVIVAVVCDIGTFISSLLLTPLVCVV
jgi:hypothetical protein